MMSIEQSRKLDKRNAMDTHQAALLNVSQLLNLLGCRSIGGARAALPLIQVRRYTAKRGVSEKQNLLLARTAGYNGIQSAELLFFNWQVFRYRRKAG